jgi:hypothetical protein
MSPNQVVEATEKMDLVKFNILVQQSKICRVYKPNHATKYLVRSSKTGHRSKASKSHGPMAQW